MITLTITLTEHNGVLSIGYEAEGDSTSVVERGVAEAIMEALPAIEAYGLGPTISNTPNNKPQH
jgi:hypothetical protein